MPLHLRTRCESIRDGFLQDEWRKFVSQTCPGPRSAHAVVATPAGGGKIFLFGIHHISFFLYNRLLMNVGGEFSSLHQNTFHHYRDFWCFDISTHSWDRIDTKIRPSARSGHRYSGPDLSYVYLTLDHRMAIFKHYIVLFGGFYDPGVMSQ